MPNLITVVGVVRQSGVDGDDGNHVGLDSSSCCGIVRSEKSSPPPLW